MRILAPPTAVTVPEVGASVAAPWRSNVCLTVKSVFAVTVPPSMYSSAKESRVPEFTIDEPFSMLIKLVPTPGEKVQVDPLVKTPLTYHNPVPETELDEQEKVRLKKLSVLELVMVPPPITVIVPEVGVSVPPLVKVLVTV